MSHVVPWALRLTRRALARRDAIDRIVLRSPAARRIELGALRHAFGFKSDELHFARAVLDRHPQLWLFRTHQQRRCGDFAVVDMSPSEPRSRRLQVLELKHARPVRIDRGGLQLLRATELRAALADTGIVVPEASLACATGDASAMLRWLEVSKP